MSYQDLPDEELLRLYQQERNEIALEVLMERFGGFIRNKVRNYFIQGQHWEDVWQEARIGLYEAIRDYDPARLSSFKSFIDLCVGRKVVSAIKTACRQKHQVLTSSIRFEQTVFRGASESSDRPRALIEILDGGAPNPSEVFDSGETQEIFEQILRLKCSDLEQKVARLYVKGVPYTDIADQLGVPVKSVDNALQRVKRKLDSNVEDGGLGL